ncbi:MAG TPA: hypothetical protein VD864_14310 [Nocardioides sp.]|nr:hypothetical protein [Nocardioides sp.]
MGPTTRIVVTCTTVAAWSLFVDAVYERRWPGTDLWWWALFVAWFGGAGVLWLVVESVVRSRRERRDP